MIKNLPNDLVDAARAVLVASAADAVKFKDTKDKGAAIAAIDQNLAQGVIAPEVAAVLKKTYSEEVKSLAEQMLDEAKKKGDVHPLAVHTQFEPRGHYNKNDEHRRKAYKVVAVGSKVKGIKAGEHLSDTDIDELPSAGYRHKAMSEETLDEGRLKGWGHGSWTTHRQHGDAVSGTTDQGSPETHSEHHLSRMTDLLDHAHHVGGPELVHKVFAAFPDSAKGEWNYSKWKYKAADKLKEEVEDLFEYHAHGSVNGKSFKINTPDVYDHKSVKSQNPHLSDSEAKAVVAHTETDNFVNGETGSSKHGRHEVTTTKNSGHFGEETEWDVELTELSKDTLGSYVKKASEKGASHAMAVQRHRSTRDMVYKDTNTNDYSNLEKNTMRDMVSKRAGEDEAKASGAYNKKRIGIARAVQRMTGKNRAERIKPLGEAGDPMKIQVDGVSKEKPLHFKNPAGGDANKHGNKALDIHFALHKKGLVSGSVSGVHGKGFTLTPMDKKHAKAITDHVTKNFPGVTLANYRKEELSVPTEVSTVEASLQEKRSEASRKLGHTLLKKWKDMTPDEQSSVAKAVNRKPGKKPMKEEIEADQNIMVHLRKSIDTEGKHTFVWADGDTAQLPEEVSRVILAQVLRLKPEARVEIQQHMQESFENTMEVYQAITEAARQKG